MRFISHRGNLNGSNPSKENNPSYIFSALNRGFDVEIDVWYDNGWWLGHDNPQYTCEESLLGYSLCHAKNKEALYRLLNMSHPPEYFWHFSDDYTITSRGNIISLVGKPVVYGGICVLPEQYDTPINPNELRKLSGICSDLIMSFKGELNG